MWLISLFGELLRDVALTTYCSLIFTFFPVSWVTGIFSIKREILIT